MEGSKGCTGVPGRRAPVCDLGSWWFGVGPRPKLSDAQGNAQMVQMLLKREKQEDEELEQEALCIELWVKNGGSKPLVR